jgi:pimeloyl-ACP methyl ester carboxylesterase
MSDRRFVDVGGHRLEYELIAARRDRLPALVFLHQGLGSVSMWREAPSRLAERTGCAALVYSRLGYGWSDPPPAPRSPDFMLSEGRAVLPELLEKLGLSDVILVGHSDGGTIALAYLAAGHRARGAILVAPHVFDEEVTRSAIAQQSAEWSDGALRRRLARHHRDPDAMFRSWAEVWLSPGFRGWTIAPLLPAVTEPLLAIQGFDDTHGTMRQVDRIAELARGPVEVKKLEGCGHDPFRDAPEFVLDLCAYFIVQKALTPGY